MNYINENSWKLFISVTAKNIREITNGIYAWEIQGRRQLAFARSLVVEDLPVLESLSPFSFYYTSKEEIDLLKSNARFDVSRHRTGDVCIPIIDLEFRGYEKRAIRNSINKNKKLNLTLENNYRKIEDVKDMLSRWSETSGEKHFQDRSSKNYFYLKSGFHENCENLFVYDGDKLISFAILSKPIDKECSYIIGKSLCIDYPGLSEYADVEAYKKVQSLGVELVHLGGGKNTVKKYKMKFPGAYEIPTYDGKIELK